MSALIHILEQAMEDRPENTVEVMNVSSKKQIVIWGVWCVVFPAALAVFFARALPLVYNEWLEILSFLTLLLIASVFPIRFRDTNIVPLHGIALAVFLQFGLMIEMFVMQLAVLTSLLSLRLTKTELYRIPLNSLVFFTVSLVSAGVYYSLGGITENLSEVQLSVMLFPIAAYAFTYFFLNNWLIFLIRKYVVKLRKTKFFDEALKMEAVSAVLIIPIGVTLVLLYEQIGMIAVFLIGIPLLSLSLILKIYNQSEITNRLLKKVSSFGYRVNGNLSVNSINELFTKTVTSIFPVDKAFIYEVHNGNLKVTQAYHASTKTKLYLKNGDNISLKVLDEGRTIYIPAAGEKEETDKEDIWGDTQSVISVPAMSNKEVTGIITLGSSRKYAFEKNHLMLLEIMANYLAVALQNAKNYELKKNESERCPLTGLYNFRYFENLLFEKFDMSGNKEDFAIILLDLDHFKRINDSYGHQSGNEVLLQVADVLVNTVGSFGTLARYGGEEFVILMEGTNVKFAEKMAESLRENIENHLFVVTDDLDTGERKSVRLTASIGVAGKTEPGESAMSVLRNADRAMYTGAKQKGRNRVSHF
ncbi:sensor domain-containing diguanylate cyclase [Evansella sp. LMS18]|uniref:sensor domain-containing diguanylate cyclase n=1 Tax=Evansella sp. LMS18 TaxID=2924033 RepID=UPI0020D159B7|nr:sensor domain-containing diguanylate cyclase [Evansella sp. LMS18]UTR11253.1 sensor domain-containing diguanylate cyclase [Evansella sp. LMS18]